MSSYEDVVRGKLRPFVPTGIRVDESAIHPRLFPFQRAITRWALRMGRAAVFAGTGLGKTSIQLEYAQQVHLHTGKSVLIFAPLAVAEQTIEEGKLQNVEVTYAPYGESILNGPPGVWISNYDRFAHFANLPLAGVVCDEASIMKSHDGKTRNALIQQYRETPFRLVATATPAPNDVSELAGYSEMLGIKTRVEMLATFFVNTGMTDQKWRLKKHAEREFARWLASWAVYIRRPSDIGFSDEGYLLPQLNIIEDIVRCEDAPEGFLFPVGLSEGIVGRAAMRRSTLEARVARAVEVIHGLWKSPTTNRSTSLGNQTQIHAPQRVPPLSPGESCRRKNSSFAGNEITTATEALGVSPITPSACEPPPTTSRERWVVWCGLNDEQDSLARNLSDASQTSNAAVPCVSISGKMDSSEKLAALAKWLSGECPVLITKPSLFGYGLNWAFCYNVLFLGLSDSWEDFYQAIRRCWRFGQQRPVNVHIVISENETAVLENVKRKELEATRLGDQLVEQMGDLSKAALEEAAPTELPPGFIDKKTGPGWTLYHGDCVEVMRDHIPSESIHMSVFSPPFATLYTYSDNPRDMGNCANHSEFWSQFEHYAAQLYRITMPGRMACLHVAQITTTLVSDGIIGLNDFRGDTIRVMKAAGWTHYREVTVDKNPQSAAVRSKSKSLMFKTLKTDRSWTGPALADHILLFRKPGDNPVPIVGGPVDNETWIKWARPVWTDIRETYTLNAAEGRGDKDEKHIAPLQLEVIERCVQLWSNQGETIFSGFAGIGSEGFQSLLCERQFVGIELKPEYYRTALVNLRRAEQMRGQQSLFDGLEAS